MRTSTIRNLSTLSLLVIVAIGSWFFIEPLLAQEGFNCSAPYLIDERLPTGGRWQMCWEHRQREGIVLYDIHYTTPDGRRRKVMEQANLAQIHVPYVDGVGFHELTDDGLGGLNLQPLTAEDCIGGSLMAEAGKGILCQQLDKRGYAYKDYNLHLQGDALRLFSVSQIRENVYIVQWQFLDDGTIEPSIGLSGRLDRIGDDPLYGWPLHQDQIGDQAGDQAEGEERRIGIARTFNYYWRMDFDIGANGANDLVEEFEFVPASANASRVLSKTKLTTEIGRPVNLERMRSWRVRDASLVNSDGHAISYHLEPLHAGHQYRGTSDEPWTVNDFYVTQYNPCEQFVSHNPTEGGCGSNVTDFVNGENVDAADIVLWYGISFHHLPRDEDEPLIHTYWDGFQLVPRDWVARNPFSLPTSNSSVDNGGGIEDTENAESTDDTGSTDNIGSTDNTVPIDGPTDESTSEPIDAPTSVSGRCAEQFVGKDADAQVAIMEGEPTCAEGFVAHLLADPGPHLDAFYRLIVSPQASDALWSDVYNRVRFGEFRFDGATVGDLMVRFPQAVAACTEAYRCDDWEKFILPYLVRGQMYQCPDVALLDANALVQNVPYGDYSCTEDIATALRPLADLSVVQALRAIVDTHEQRLSRRNGLRVLGRLATGAEGDPARVLVTERAGPEIRATLLSRLQEERAPEVLHDAIWIADSYFYPFFETQPALEQITEDTTFEEALRFRAIRTVSRLIQSKETVIQADLDFFHRTLQSDNYWVRAQAAFAFETLENEPLTAAQRAVILSSLETAWRGETVFATQASIASALDIYDDRGLLVELRRGYEAQHLGNVITNGRMNIISGLAVNELPHFMGAMQDTESAFFELMDAPFNRPVPGDLNESITLVLFANRDIYREYMGAFVCCANAGGVYIEKDAKLYTYERTPEESSLTAEELTKHEFTHYLQGRYVFPNVWTDSGYHTEPKGWADEGLAEFFGHLDYDGQGNTNAVLPEARIANVCATSNHRDLSDLLRRRAGYDQAGVFDYDYAWAFVYYLMTERHDTLSNVYNAFREDTYRLNNFPAIAGVPSIDALEADWHIAMNNWCGSLPAPVSRTLETPAPVSIEHQILSIGGSPFAMPLLAEGDPGHLTEQVIRVVDANQ